MATTAPPVEPVLRAGDKPLDRGREREMNVAMLEVPATGATRPQIEAAMAGKIVARGTIVGRAKPAQ